LIDLIYKIYKYFSKTERRVFWAALSVFLVSSVLWSLLLFYSKTVEVPVESSSYQEGIIGQPIFINPLLAGNNDADRDLIELLFSDLLDLAESHKISEDGQTWKVTLKPDLKWSDGKALTSDDVIFTIDIIQNSDARSPLFLTWQGVIVERLSEQEIEFTLRTPYAFFLDNLNELKIIPKHIFGVLPPENFRLSNFNLEPVGSGPYKYLSFEKRKDGFITDYHLTANEYYPLQKPFLKDFNVKFYKNTGDLIGAFNKKQVDGFGGLNPKNIEELKLTKQIVKKIIPRYYAIFINKNTGPSTDKNVVRALNLATDKQKIIDEILGGEALIINEPLLPVIEGYDRAADPGNEFSLEKAKEILDKAGWKLNPETNVRSKKIGRAVEQLEYALIVPQIPFLTETANIIKENWAEIGVKLNPILLNPNDINNEVIKTRNYQMILFGNVLRNNPDLFSFWHSSERFYPGLNLALYDNKKVDALLESIRKNLNAESRKNDLTKLQQLISDDQPAIFLYSPKYLYAALKNLGGWEEEIIATPSDRFEKVNLWYLETARVFK